MKHTAFRLPVTLALFVSACTGTSPDSDLISDGFVTPDENGAFPLPLVDVHQGLVANAFAYQTGFQQDVGLRVFAGLLPDTTVSGIASGDAVFDAAFQGTQTTEIRVIPPPVPAGDPLLAGISSRFAGDITLGVSLDGTRIAGSGDGLTVAGTLDGQAMTGTVTFNGLTGPLQGLAGADRTIGAFYGIATDRVFSGGFTGPAR